LLHRSSAEICIAQINSCHMNLGEVGVAKVSQTEVAPFQIVEIETYPAQINSAQIDSAEFAIEPYNTRKISFPSSIPSEQFFSSHNSTPEIINALNNSPTNSDSFGEQNIEPEAIYGINSTNAPLTNIPDSRWVSSLNPTYKIGDRTSYSRSSTIRSLVYKWQYYLD
jgi:hypothetical protein